MSTIYTFQAITSQGEPTDLSKFEGKTLLIVNTASECGLTPQYEGLQRLYDTYKDRGLVVLGFPSNQFGGQEPGTNEQIQQFCSLNYGVTFPLFAKTDVIGEGAHPLFVYLTESTGGQVTWNFTKFLVSRDGSEVLYFEPKTSPDEMTPAIEKLLG